MNDEVRVVGTTVSGSGNSLPGYFTQSTQDLTSNSVFGGTLTTYIGCSASVFNNNIVSYI